MVKEIENSNQLAIEFKAKIQSNYTNQSKANKELFQKELEKFKLDSYAKLASLDKENKILKEVCFF